MNPSFLISDLNLIITFLVEILLRALGAVTGPKTYNLKPLDPPHSLISTLATSTIFWRLASIRRAASGFVAAVMEIRSTFRFVPGSAVSRSISIARLWNSTSTRTNT
jgi:hypothetical protein